MRLLNQHQKRRKYADVLALIFLSFDATSLTKRQIIFFFLRKMQNIQSRVSMQTHAKFLDQSHNKMATNNMNLIKFGNNSTCKTLFLCNINYCQNCSKSHVDAVIKGCRLFFRELTKSKKQRLTKTENCASLTHLMKDAWLKKLQQLRPTPWVA